MKRAIETTMDAGAKGIKIQLAGRLGGSEMARCEKATAGSLPLSTLRAKIDYGFTEAWTAQGNMGVQVWVNQGCTREMRPMALMPKRVKHRKSQRGRIKGKAQRGNRVVSLAITACRQRKVAGSRRKPSSPGVLLHSNTSAAKVGCISAFSRTSRRPARPLETRMGTGKGEPAALGGRRQGRHGDVRVGWCDRGSKRRLCFARLAHKMPFACGWFEVGGRLNDESRKSGRFRRIRF